MGHQGNISGMVDRIKGAISITSNYYGQCAGFKSVSLKMNK